MSINKVIMLGHLGQDPDLKQAINGSHVCNFNIATNESWTDKNGERQERTEWHRIVVWGKLGEHCKQYLSKGGEVLIEGSLHTKNWDDKNGEKHYTTEIIAKTVQFIGGAKHFENNFSGVDIGVGQLHESKNEAKNKYINSFTTDDIPF